MTSRILCAVDLTHTENVEGLLGKAAELAGLHGAALSVITVIPDYGTSWVGSFFKEGTLKEGTLKEAALAASAVLHDTVQRTVPEIRNVQHIVEIGVVYEQVLQAALDCRADLIVVGANKPTMTDRLLGPNFARIVRSAAASVLVVRL